MALDIGIVIAYLLLLVIIGLRGGKQVESAADFSAGGKKYGAGVIFCSLAASYVGGGYSAGNAAESFENGIGMTVALCGFGLTTVLIGKYLVPGIARFAGVSSTGGIMTRAYGRFAGIVTGFFAFFCCASVVGAQMESMGVVFHTLLGISPTAGVLLGCGIILLYSTVGGLQSLIAADMVQFALLALGMPLLLVLALTRAGGIGAVLAATPSCFFNPLNGTTPAGFFSLFMTMAFGEALVPPYMQRLLIGKNLRATAKGTVYSGLFSLPFFGITCLIGLVARALAVTNIAGDAMPQLILSVLPIGARGLVMAAMISIMLSAADGFLNGAAISLVQDVLLPLRPDISDRRQLALLRLTNLLTGAAAVTVALLVPNVFHILLLAYSFWSPLIVVPLAAALLGVQTDRRSFCFAVVAGLLTTVLWEYALQRPLDITGSTVGMLANAATFSLCTYRFRRSACVRLRLRVK